MAFRLAKLEAENARLRKGIVTIGMAGLLLLAGVAGILLNLPHRF